MRRGDLVTVALQGDQGKPRPALVIQTDLFSDLAGVTILPITSTLIDAPLMRIAVEPDPSNGLGRRSHIMIDKPQTPPRAKVGSVIGHLDEETLLAVNRALAVFLGVV